MGSSPAGRARFCATLDEVREMVDAFELLELRYSLLRFNAVFVARRPAQGTGHPWQALSSAPQADG